MMQSVTSVYNMDFKDVLELENVDIDCTTICACADCIFAFSKMKSYVERAFIERKKNIALAVDKMKDSFNFALHALSNMPDIKDEQIGNYIGCELTDDFVVNHYFECLKKGYVSWKWVVAVACVEGQETVTVCEIDLLPNDGALLAPKWIPWKERLLVNDFAPNEYVPDEVIDRTRAYVEKKRAEILPPKLVEGQSIFSEHWKGEK